MQYQFLWNNGNKVKYFKHSFINMAERDVFFFTLSARSVSVVLSGKCLWSVNWVLRFLLTEPQARTFVRDPKYLVMVSVLKAQCARRNSPSPEPRTRECYTSLEGDLVPGYPSWPTFTRREVPVLLQNISQGAVPLCLENSSIASCHSGSSSGWCLHEEQCERKNISQYAGCRHQIWFRMNCPNSGTAA